jgi:hypothetical protein
MEENGIGSVSEIVGGLKLPGDGVAVTPYP